MTKLPTGSIGWVDLTVENAEEIRDFYSSVVGWKPENVARGCCPNMRLNPEVRLTAECHRLYR